MKNNVKAISTKRKQKSDLKVAMFLLGPFLLWWLVVCGFPLVFGIAMGFLEWPSLSEAPLFVGLKNYRIFFGNSVYYLALWRSVWLGGLCLIITMLIAFFVALALTNLPYGKGVLRTLWYIPAVTSVAVISQIMLVMIEPNTGIINRFLTSNGLGVIDVTYSVTSGVLMIVFYSVWKGVGGNMLFWIAGFQSIDRQLYEAASIDGAGIFSKFKNITLPGLRPFFTYALITGVIGAIQIYEQVMFITGGGPVKKTQTSVFLIMTDAFSDFNLGMAGASSMVILFLVFGFAVVYLRMQSQKLKKDGDER